jgi:hypothetical protein
MRRLKPGIGRGGEVKEVDMQMEVYERSEPRYFRFPYKV